MKNNLKGCKRSLITTQCGIGLAASFHTAALAAIVRKSNPTVKNAGLPCVGEYKSDELCEKRSDPIRSRYTYSSNPIVEQDELEDGYSCLQLGILGLVSAFYPRQDERTRRSDILNSRWLFPAEVHNFHLRPGLSGRASETKRWDILLCRIFRQPTLPWQYRPS